MNSPKRSVMKLAGHKLRHDDLAAYSCSGGHSHQTLKKAVRGKNLDVYEGYFRGILDGCEDIQYSSATFCELC